MECKPSFNKNIYKNIDSIFLTSGSEASLNKLVVEESNGFASILLNYRTASAVTNIYFQKCEIINGVENDSYNSILNGVGERSQFLSSLRYYLLSDNSAFSLLSNELRGILTGADSLLKYQLVSANQLNVAKSINSVALRKTSKSDLLFGIDWIYSFVESVYFYDYRNFFSPMTGILFNDYGSATHSFM